MTLKEMKGANMENDSIIISDEGFYGGGDCRNETSAIGY